MKEKPIGDGSDLIKKAQDFDFSKKELIELLELIHEISITEIRASQAKAEVTLGNAKESITILMKGLYDLMDQDSTQFNCFVKSEPIALELLGQHNALEIDISKIMSHLGDLPRNENFMLNAIGQNSEVMQYASDDLRADESFMLKALERNSEVVQYLSEENKKDPAIKFFTQNPITATLIDESPNQKKLKVYKSKQSTDINYDLLAKVLVPQFVNMLETLPDNQQEPITIKFDNEKNLDLKTLLTTVAKEMPGRGTGVFGCLDACFCTDKQTIYDKFMSKIQLSLPNKNTNNNRVNDHVLTSMSEFLKPGMRLDHPTHHKLDNSLRGLRPKGN